MDRKVIILLLTCFSLAVISVFAQKPPSSFDRERGRMILAAVKKDLKDHYYDPKFHGMDLDARFKQAEEKIKVASSLGQIYGIIAQVLIDLNDSHTFFQPPGRTYTTEYGWQIQMIGDKCYVVAVKPGSDAEAKGLKEGDEIYSIDGFAPLRENLWKIEYTYQALRPKPGVRFVVIKPDGQEQELDISAKVKQGKRVVDFASSQDVLDLIRRQEQEERLNRHRFFEIEKELLIWKMPGFDLGDAQVDEIGARARKFKTLIVDLRGNGGGYVSTLLRMVSNIFDHDVNLGDVKRRKETKPLVAKTRGGNAFTGKLIVLTDSRSASAAELFARVVQLEKRGIVIGDVSSGAVMQSLQHGHDLGMEVVIYYAVSVTDADIIMSDGKSLEHVGVIPDELMLPKASDLAAKRDPVLAHAASLAGVTISPEQAGKLFPIEWRK